jgi:putative DNA primase/helicase
MQRVWQEARRLIEGDPVRRYLARRGVHVPLVDTPAVLRYHPHLAYTDDRGERFTYHPAMVAKVEAPDGALVSLHRTYLTADGRKAPVATGKKLMPSALPGGTRGAAIRLYAAGETLAVAEGIETALAVRQLTGLPVWSCLFASGLAAVVVPASVRLVVICADQDAAGITNAQALARRLLLEGRRVKLLAPETPGTDWLDTLEGTHACATQP